MKMPEIPGGMPFAPTADKARTMLRLKRRQREILADKMPEMANIVAGAIVIGFATLLFAVMILRERR